MVATVPAAPESAQGGGAEAALAPAVAPPTTGRWIEVDVTRLVVRLMEGSQAIKVISPVAVGAEVNTGSFNSTQTGLFRVYDKRRDLEYDAPYDTYISEWVAFDPEMANGFHSFLKDARGNVVESATGRISNGCIRTPDSVAVYEFAEIGMPVLVHL